MSSLVDTSNPTKIRYNWLLVFVNDEDDEIKATKGDALGGFPTRRMAAHKLQEELTFTALACSAKGRDDDAEFFHKAAEMWKSIDFDAIDIGTAVHLVFGNFAAVVYPFRLDVAGDSEGVANRWILWYINSRESSVGDLSGSGD